MKRKFKLKTGICLCLLFVCCLIGYAQDNSLSGTWNYKAPDAPYGYDTGTVQFKNTDGKLTATVNINGSVIPIDKLEKKGNVYVCNLSVDYTNVKVTFKPDGEKMSAIATMDDGTELKVEMTAKKE